MPEQQTVVVGAARPRSSTRRTATRCSWSRTRSRARPGWTRRPTASRSRSRASSSCGSARRAATSWRSLEGVKAGQEVVTAGAFKLRNGAPVVVDNSVKPDARARPAAREPLTMQFTDIFIRRPVLAIVVNLVIVIAGLQAMRSLNVRQYPKLESATVTVRTVYVGASADLVRGFITTPLERAIAAADGIDYIESQSVQGLSTINVRLKLNFDAADALADISARVNQVRADLPPEAEVPAIHIEPSDAAVRGDVPELRLGHPRGQPGHRLPDPRRAAAAVRDRRRAARRHPRRPHVRAARLAEARAHGGAQRQPVAGARRRSPPTTTCPRSARPRARSSSSTSPPTTDLRSVDEFKKLVIREQDGTLVRLRGRGRRRARRRRLRPGRAVLAARRPCSWASGCCPTPTRST